MPDNLSGQAAEKGPSVQATRAIPAWNQACFKGTQEVEMPQATAILRKEHDSILRMLDATEIVIRRIDEGVKVKPQTLHDLLEFFRLFADKCHHGKEEELLFPLLKSRGMARAGGPTGVMLHEHEVGRALVREMDVAAEACSRGKAAQPQWARAAGSYVNLLRQHISKENNIPFRDGGEPAHCRGAGTPRRRV